MARTLPTGAVIALALLAGFGLGVPAGDRLAEGARQTQWRAAAARARALGQGWARDPAQRRRDSVGWDSLGRLRPRPAFPLEVRRVQALSHCAVSFLVRDSAWAHLPLFEVRAQEWADTATVARAFAYREGGFRSGDTVTVVLPDVACGAPMAVGVGGAFAAPRGPLRVEER